MSKPVRRTDDQRALLDRILNTPHLAQVVPQLPPELLHRIIQHCGLEDCGALVALTTPEQLARIFDLDLWRAVRPGVDERFDAARFGQWLEVLVEEGAAIAAQKLAEMDVDLVIAGLARHLRVFDSAAVAPYMTTDGELIDASHVAHDDIACEIGGYRLVARRADSWDAIVEVLTALGTEHPACFHRVMHGCRRLSNSRPEIDGLDNLLADGEQVIFDVAFDRERRRDVQGFVTPAQARAFLQMSRQRRPRVDSEPAANPIARAYLRAAEEMPETPPAAAEPVPENAGEAVAAVVEVLRDAGILDAPPRALLTGSQEAASPVARQVGWTVLHDDVVMYAAERLIDVLKGFQCHDRDIQAGLNRLRIELTKSCRAGAPWLARNAIEVIASLDLPAWAALLGLIDECPVLHAAVRGSLDRQTRAIGASDFEFIALNSQIATVHEFMHSLLDTLSR